MAFIFNTPMAPVDFKNFLCICFLWRPARNAICNLDSLFIVCFMINMAFDYKCLFDMRKIKISR